MVYKEPSQERIMGKGKKIYDKTIRRLHLLALAELRPGERLGPSLGSSFGKDAEPAEFDELWVAHFGEGSVAEVCAKLVSLGVPIDDALNAISRGEIKSEAVAYAPIALDIGRFPASPAAMEEMVKQNQNSFLFVDIASARDWLDHRQKPSA